MMSPSATLPRKAVPSDSMANTLVGISEKIIANESKISKVRLIFCSLFFLLGFIDLFKYRRGGKHDRKRPFLRE